MNYIKNSNLISLLLLMRQHQVFEGNSGMTLEDQEKFENQNWDDLLEENHRKFKSN